ncbi:MAG: hypothetical protein PHY48_07735 [Candidatus Cloacimonetes bacterium]|nr:hypothetical protein [Candidatus Cloacimonadota bacterium]
MQDSESFGVSAMRRSIHGFCLFLFMFNLSLLLATTNRQDVLIGKIPRLHALNSSVETVIRFSHPIGQENIELIYVNQDGHRHIGVDLNLAEQLESRVVGEKIEEYMLAYLLDCNLENYALKASIPQLNKQDLAAKITTLKLAMQLNTQTADDRLIQIEINNPKLNLKFEIPLDLAALYGKDKKDLEEELHQQIVSVGHSKPHNTTDYPDLEQLSPYQDSLYVWEKPALDSLFTAPRFLAMQDAKLLDIFNPQYPLESLFNYLQTPQMLHSAIPVLLKHNLYGNSSKQARVPFSALHKLLSQGMSTALNIRPIDQKKYAVMLFFYDSVTGVRHLLHGSFDAEQLFCSQHKEIALTLYSYIIGDAEDMQNQSNREPLWQINIK